MIGLDVIFYPFPKREISVDTLFFFLLFFPLTLKTRKRAGFCEGNNFFRALTHASQNTITHIPVDAQERFKIKFKTVETEIRIPQSNPTFMLFTCIIPLNPQGQKNSWFLIRDPM